MSYFSEDMTYIEALTTLNTVCEGMTKEERKILCDEYKKVIAVITERELDGEPVMTSYPVGGTYNNV